MTTPGSDDRAALPDPRLDAAWRAASNEAPPRRWTRPSTQRRDA
jgi:hypothetical protein